MATAYQTPKLTNYGSIAKLTQAGTSFDGGGGGLVEVVVGTPVLGAEICVGGEECGSIGLGVSIDFP